MTPNELADHMEKYFDSEPYCDEVVAMLRQQQAEIEALKLQLHTTLTNRDLRTYDGKTEINNEPVAWMLTLPDGTHDWILDGNGCEGYIPLYTHPAKTLTDEEIWELHQEFIDEVPCGHSMQTVGFIEFARAILRKD